MIDDRPRIVCRACFERNQTGGGAASRKEMVVDGDTVELRCVEHGIVAAWRQVRFDRADNGVVVAPSGVSAARCPHCRSTAPASNVKALFDRALTFCQGCRRWGRWA